MCKQPLSNLFNAMTTETPPLSNKSSTILRMCRYSISNSLTNRNMKYRFAIAPPASEASTTLAVPMSNASPSVRSTSSRVRCAVCCASLCELFLSISVHTVLFCVQFFLYFSQTSAIRVVRLGPSAGRCLSNSYIIKKLCLC